MTEVQLPESTLMDLIEESREHASRHGYNIDSLDIAATCIAESVESLNVDLSAEQQRHAARELLWEVQNAG